MVNKDNGIETSVENESFVSEEETFVINAPLGFEREEKL